MSVFTNSLLRYLMGAATLLLLLLAGHLSRAQAPTISSFSPASGAVGSTVVITGSNFTGTTSVRFGEISARFTVNSSTQLTATVPRVASTQPLSVTNASSYALSSTAFTVTRTSSSLTYSLVASNFAGVSGGANAAPAVGDLDGDNLLDLLVGLADGTISRYEQTAVNGAGFTALGSLRDNSNAVIDMGSQATVTIIDLDGNGRLSRADRHHRGRWLGPAGTASRAAGRGVRSARWRAGAAAGGGVIINEQ